MRWYQLAPAPAPGDARKWFLTAFRADTFSRMCVGNVLRARWRKGEPVTNGGWVVKQASRRNLDEKIFLDTP